MFFIQFEDYMTNYAMTSICTDFYGANHHTSAFYDFTEIKAQSFFFRLTQTHLASELFTITVTQQGDRLGKERLKTKPWEPCPIKIILKQNGKRVAGKYERAFNNFLEIDNIDIQPGVYELYVEPAWNESAQAEHAHKVLCIDILCPEKISLEVEV